ncbi:Hypothetical predicted protein [Lecanosticta acicola]|uniref:Uncharacterized protein n=1 Tax=Lecanosticta acicola TaxID=111012 RepID=A0AAI8YZV7_9PEZI|nr:Hypothetical predicted protein [Lecanosticta acicola]
MGLPIWRDPEEKKSARNVVKVDATAALRSSIRRRPSVHGRRTIRTRLPRDPSLIPPRFQRSPPPSSGFNGLREPRRTEDRGVPPISSLLEAANRNRDGLPPPPVPESHNYVVDLTMTDEEEERGGRRQPHGRWESREIRDARRNLAELRNRRDALQRQRDRIRRENEALEDSADGLRRSPTPPADRNDPSVPMHTIILNPGEPLRIIRSPEPIHRRNRPHSRNESSSSRRSALPTPPLETSGPDDGDRDMPTRRRSHPLSNTWRAESPVDGLGDRNRSPSPGDGWTITITPDETLPSAESSFASTAASQSFNASSNSTQITEPDGLSVNSSSRRETDNGAEQSDSASSVDPDDLVCTDEDMFSTEAFAQDMYYHEMRTSEGRSRIAAHQRLRDEEGNRFALAAEPALVDIGFRLIEEALETDEGRERILQIRHTAPENVQHFEDMLAASRRVRNRRLRRSARVEDSPEPPRPRPDRYSQETRDVIEETRSQVHDYFRRFGADTLRPRSTSPPPQYEPLNSHPDVNTFTSRDGPEPHPVSPPSQRSEREVSDALLSGDVQELDSMRRIVERLAARDDVPEEWWMSMGLNLSRTRPRHRSPHTARRSSPRDGELDTVRSGRVERGNPRL